MADNLTTDKKCPKCGSGWHSVFQDSTLMNGPHNITTYHCMTCGYSWTSKEPTDNLVTIPLTPPKLAVRCVLCEETTQEITGFSPTLPFFICDRCKKLWKEIIHEREKKSK